MIKEIYLHELNNDFYTRLFQTTCVGRWNEYVDVSLLYTCRDNSDFYFYYNSLRNPCNFLRYILDSPFSIGTHQSFQILDFYNGGGCDRMVVGFTTI